MEFILIRTAFLSLSSFTFLNSVKILHIPLHFPWLVLFLVSLLTWLFWEEIYKKRFDFPMYMGAFFLFHLYADTIGSTFKFYDKFNWYDELTHFTGGAAAGALAILILSYFNKKNQWKISLRTLIIFAISLALSLTVFYELWELFQYSVLNYKLVISGPTDTASDLLFDFLGTTVAVLILTAILKKKGYFSLNVSDSKTK